MILIDNSEYMRNGDYAPSRFEAQSDAVTTVFGRKVDSNPENTVGVMTMAGKAPQVLVTHTKDIGHILSALHESRSKLSGYSDIVTAISVAQLALKHRTDKNLRQRIVVFLGSPLASPASTPIPSRPFTQSTDEKTLVKLAKKLKKNNVAIDIVSFGEDESRLPNDTLLRTFVEHASSGENSHFVSAPPGEGRLLSEVVLGSEILAEDGVTGGMPRMEGVQVDGVPGVGVGAGDNFEFGVDPSMDPELAMALRMSMEEERARQSQQTQHTAGETSGSTALTSVPEDSVDAPTTATVTVPMDTVPAGTGMDEDDEEERMLAEALALSTQEGDIEMDDNGNEDIEMTEEESIARAIQLSLESQDGQNQTRNDQGEAKEKQEKK